MGKKKGNKTEPVIPTNLKANITSKMRAENEIVETFDNAILPVSCVMLGSLICILYITIAMKSSVYSHK